LSTKLIRFAEEGISLDLDPSCVSDFKNAKNLAWIIKQRSKAELETHVKKGKW
jgi:hypothetical protein